MAEVEDSEISFFDNIASDKNLLSFLGDKEEEEYAPDNVRNDKAGDETEFDDGLPFWDLSEEQMMKEEFVLFSSSGDNPTPTSSFLADDDDDSITNNSIKNIFTAIIEAGTGNEPWPQIVPFYDNNKKKDRGWSSVKCLDKEENIGASSSAKSEKKEIKELNILILGETGVGKSTWINGIMNYLTFEDLKEAIIGDPVFCIPTKYTITNNKLEKVVVKMGQDENELEEVGQACTQSPKSYVLTYEDYIISLIDTPGIGDPRGFKQDQINFKGVLSYMSNFEELHGICILLHPNKARLTVMFEFCVKELLAHLHKDASKNISFVFTNARSTFYLPGDSLPPLEKMLSKDRYRSIVLSENTIYCMDNEPIRFLAAVKNGIEFDDKEFKSYAESWEISVKETKRLIKHISSLLHHKISQTLTLNETKKLILAFTEPIAQISKNIQTNIDLAEDKKEEIKNSKLRGTQLLQQLFVPVADFDIVELGYPRTVCTASKCIQVVEIEGIKKVKFTTWCHERCYLEDITPDQYPQPGLQKCSAMDNGTCINCGCTWDYHQHIVYEYVDVEKRIKNNAIGDLIRNNNDSIGARNKLIDELNQRVKDLIEEKKYIVGVSTKFGHFLDRNAITPYNDALESYLKYLIRAEEEKVALTGDRKNMEDLENILFSYLEEVEILKEAMKNDENILDLNYDEVKGLVDSLYNLKLNGRKFRNIVEKVQTANNTQVEYNEMKFNPDSKKNKTKTKGLWNYLKSLNFFSWK